MRPTPEVGPAEAFVIAKALRWLAYGLAAVGLVAAVLWLVTGPTAEAVGLFDDPEPDWGARIAGAVYLVVGTVLATALFIALAAIIDLLGSGPRGEQVEALTKAIAQNEPGTE